MLGLLLTACTSGETAFNTRSDDAYASTGDALAVVEPLSLEFSELTLGVMAGKELSIFSEGSEALDVYSISIMDDADEVFTFGDAGVSKGMSLEPGRSEEILILVTLEEQRSSYASLLLQTNDAEQLNLVVPLSAHPAEEQGETGLSEG